MHKTIDRVLAELMARNGDNQVSLSKASGVGQSTISRILKPSGPKGIKSPTDEQVSRLAAHYGVSTDQLRGRMPLDPLGGQAPDKGTKPSTGLALKESGAAYKVQQMLEKVGKGLTDDARRKIIEAAQDGAPASNVVTGDFQRPARLTDGDILIPQYDIRASMGHGQVPADYVEFMRNVVVSGVQLEKLGLDFTSPANLSIITGWGESMAPTIKSKDPVIVDRGITEFMGDGVYVITWDDMLYIKRLQNAGDGKLELISDNPKHKDRIVNTDEVAIHARVLLVWNSQKL